MKKFKLLPLILLPLLSAQANAETEDERRARLAIPVLEVKSPVAGLGWVTGSETFDYILPCVLEDTPYSAIVAHGVNRMDLLTESADGTFNYRYDISRGFPRMTEFCVAIAAPKSGISTIYNEFDEPQKWRNWWSTTGVKGADGIPVRDEIDEINAVIGLMEAAGDFLKKPTYLVIGNDSGQMSVRVSQLLFDDDKMGIIDGIIVVNGEEYSVYDKDGSVWRSEDNLSGGV